MSPTLLSEELLSTSRPQVLLYAYETFQPSILMQSYRKKSDASVVSKIEWLWEHGKQNLNTPTFLFQG